MIIGQLRINSLRNKCDCLVQQITENFDDLMVSKTKVYNSFPVGQLLLDGYDAPIRLNRDIHGRDLILFIREDITCKTLSLENRPVERFYAEINLR